MKRQFPIFNSKIENVSDDAVDIHIHGAIVDAETQQMCHDWLGDDTSVSFKSFWEELNKVEAKAYNVYINSPGAVKELSYLKILKAIHNKWLDIYIQHSAVKEPSFLNDITNIF